MIFVVFILKWEEKIVVLLLQKEILWIYTWNYQNLRLQVYL